MAEAMPNIAESALEAAGVGGWDLDVRTGRLAWTTVTFRIHEIDPAGQPPLEGALDFYPPEARPVIAAAVQACISAGTAWDLELPFVTARGRRLWVRACGQAVRENGQTVRLFGAFQDITARRELSERAERLSVVARQMTNAIIMLDRAGRAEWLNEAFTRQTGYGIDDLRGRRPGELLCGPQTDPATQHHTADCYRDGIGFDVEMLNYTRAGRPYWVAITATALRDEAGAVTGFILVGTDVTARRAAEEEARRESTERQRAEALLRDVLDTLPNAVTAYDSEERYILCNRAYDELFPAWAKFAVPGRTREEVLRLAAERGQFADSGSTPEEQAAWVARHLAFHRNPGDARAIVLANGRIMEAVDRRSESGNVVTVRTDTTDLKRAEALLRDVLDALPSGVTAFDADERLILTNRAYAEMFPISARFATPGRRLEEMLRLSAEHGQYADTAATAEARAAWVAEHLAYFRNPGAARTLRLANGRFVQVSERRSDTGYLVTVRTDATDLKRAESLLRDVLEAIPSAVVAYGPDEHLVLTNQAYREMFPIATRFATPGQRLEDLVRLGAEAGQYADVPADAAGRETWIGAQLAYHRSPGPPRAMRLNDGRLMQVVERRSEDGNLVSVRTDTSELHRAEALLRDVLDAIPSAVIAYDDQERLTVWNQAAVEMMPVSARFARPGITLEEMVRLSVEYGQFPDSGQSPAEREAWVARQLACYRGAGGPRTVRLPNGRFAQAREQRSENGHLVCVRTDTTDLMSAQADLRLQAERDPLTLLANRPAFLAALDRALEVPADERRPGGALLLLDIDYFKQINDTLGHDMGDALLIEIAGRLRALLRLDDVAARLGGDEYGVLIPGLTEPRAVAARLDLMHAALSAPVDLAGRRQPVGTTIGVTLFPADGTHAASLLKNADLALYEAKRNGRDRWCAFRAEQAEALHHHVQVADALRRAIARNGLTVALQPKRLLRGGHAGFEALARWHDGTRWVPPSDFIPVAEDSGLIVSLGRAVMDAALARMRALRDQGVQPGRVAVNVTGPQLLDSHFIGETLDALGRHGLCPADLELELTETVLFGRAAERIEAVLREFSRIGITLALDDFGTGYASLAHLSRLPIDRLKIDQSFVAGIGKGGPGGVIARTVVSLAHSLGMESIAEGVETAEQLAFLDTAGCDAGQGYLFSRPLLTIAEALDYLRAEAGVAARPAAATIVPGVVPANAGCQ